MIRTQVGKCAIALTFFIVAIFVFEKVAKDVHKKRACYQAMFAGYCGVVLWITLLSRQPMSERIVLLVPFESYSAAQQGYMANCAVAAKDGVVTRIEQVRCFLYGYNWLILNIILFVPFGILISRAFPGINSYSLFCYGVSGSIGIEMIQCIFKLGCMDIDDLIQNTIGLAVGFMVSRLLQIGNMNKQQKISRTTTGAML